MPPITYPPFNAFALLGHALDSAPLSAALRNWLDLEYIDDDDLKKARENGRLSVFNADLGLYLFFTDDVSYISRFGIPVEPGALVLTRVSMVGRFNERFSPYTGELPGGLTVAQPFTDWQRALGQPETSQELDGAVRKARWQHRGAVLDVSFRPEGDVLLVSVAVPYSPLALEAAAERQARHASLPTAEQWTRLFGTSFERLMERPELALLDLRSREAEAMSYGEIDFSEEDGFELYVRPGHKLDPALRDDADPAAIRLSGVRFRCDLDFKSHAWTGAMPFGITFDDAPEVAARKIGRAPDRENFDVTTGHQLWKFAKVEIHILYSLIEDHVERVTVRAMDLA